MRKTRSNVVKRLAKVFARNNKGKKDEDKKEFELNYVRLGERKKTRNKIPKRFRKVSPYVMDRKQEKRIRPKGTQARIKNRQRMKKESQRRNRKAK